MNNQEVILRVIKNLTDAIEVGVEAKEDPDKSYPYAWGYGRVSMLKAIKDLSELLEDQNVTD